MKKRVIILLLFFSCIFVLELGYGYSVLNKKEPEKEKKYTNVEPELYFNIKEFEILSNNFYLALNDTAQINYKLKTESNYEEKLSFTSSNPNVATVDDQGNIMAIGVGTSTIELKIKEEIRTIEVVVTDLINIMPETYTTKKLLSCNEYTKEENDLLDTILESRVKDAGLKTRAGVLAAARFLTLEFPYRIAYFSENGRLDTFNQTTYADGEGRYYHKGLYLHSSRYQNIVKSMYGPATWGCFMYSFVSGTKNRNGLDCSGFITWILLNGGYDPGDIGAGITNVKDMTDLGNKVRMTKAIESHSLKAGDLLSGYDSGGGHIALLIGMKNGYYFVAESLWGNNAYGAVIQRYTKESLINNFYWQIDMNDYYGNDGNYTEYWTND